MNWASFLPIQTAFVEVKIYSSEGLGYIANFLFGSDRPLSVKYEDFDPKMDNVAAYTVGGLVAGKVLAKAGFFVFLAKFWKLIAVALAASGGYILNFFKSKKKNQEIETSEEPQISNDDKSDQEINS